MSRLNYKTVIAFNSFIPGTVLIRSSRHKLSHGFVVLHGVRLVLFSKLHIPGFCGRFPDDENEVVYTRGWHLLHVPPLVPAQASLILPLRVSDYFALKETPCVIPLLGVLIRLPVLLRSEFQENSHFLFRSDSFTCEVSLLHTRCLCSTSDALSHPLPMRRAQI